MFTCLDMGLGGFPHSQCSRYWAHTLRRNDAIYPLTSFSWEVSRQCQCSMTSNFETLWNIFIYIMTSCNRKTFHINGSLCGESTNSGWILSPEGQKYGTLGCFFLLFVKTMGWANRWLETPWYSRHAIVMNTWIPNVYIARRKYISNHVVFFVKTLQHIDHYEMTKTCNCVQRKR